MSWLNFVEGWCALLTKRHLQRGVFTHAEDVGASIHADTERTNAEPQPFSCKEPDPFASPGERVL